MPPSLPSTASSLLFILSVFIVSVSCLDPSSGGHPSLIAPGGVADGDGSTTAVDSAKETAGLNTYAITAFNVDVQTGLGGGRQGTTRLKVKFSVNNLQQAMPVVIADPQTGLVHDVLDSFRFLKVGHIGS